MKQYLRVSFIIATTFLIALCAVMISPAVRVGAAPQSVTKPQLSQHPPHVFRNTTGQHALAPLNSSSNLIYNGGSVLENNESLYAIFWEPGNNVAAGYNNLIERFFGDIGGSPLYQIAHQYADSSLLSPTGARFAGAWVDNGAYPRNPLLDSNIQQEVTHAQQVNGWPQTSPNNIFFVFTGANQNICTDSSQTICASNFFCGYHNIFGSSTVYAAMPYAASFSCNPGSSPNFNDADQTINVASHEELEAATDPQIHAWMDSSSNEIGDKCAWTFGPRDAQGGDVVLNGHEYILQQEWDNYTSSCRMIPSTTILPGTWPLCSNENGTCPISKQETVAFGANSRYSYFDLTARGLACNVGTLGDPNLGTYKACYVEDVPPGTNAWTLCSGEGGTCIFNGSTMAVAFGANGQFHYATVTNGAACNNSTFGDPIVGTVKACYIMAPPPGTATWTLCATDNGTCFFPGNGGTHEVAYGANGRYVYSSVTATSTSGVTCSTSIFGDPNPGVVKACYWASTTV